MAQQSLEQSIFLQAIGLTSPADRAAYLDEACRDNPGLRTELDALLAAHDRLGGVPLPAVPPEATGAFTPANEVPGAVIGQYRLLEQIGEGGMGTVWMAQQTEPVKRLVALKLIKAGMDSKQVISRFEAERQALAIMDHPNIAKVLDAGTTEVAASLRDATSGRGATGLPYFVMELVKGVPITKYCDEHRLTPRQRLELFIPVCQAIQHAHQKGIIHRDLKPSNVLVAQYDGKPVPKVIDFGVAKATGQPLTDQTLVTGFGALVGTLEYMSPEQAEVNQLDIDTRSDIYSLGVLLYELLAGSPPFSRKELEKAGFLEMLRVIREQEPSKPSTKLSSSDALPALSANRGTEPAKLTKLVRGELDWIVMMALEKDRSRRYETANAFAADVQRYLADEPVLACPPSATYRLRKFARRNKVAIACTNLVLVTLLTLTGGIGWNVRDRASRRAAVEQEVTLAVREAERWQEQAKWQEALSAAKRAHGLLADDGSDEIHDRVRQLCNNLEMVLRLEEIPLAYSEWRVDRFDYEAGDRAYAQAFGDCGIDVVGLPADQAAARVRARAGIAPALAAALDDWSYARSQKDRPGSAALRAVAQAVDPDPWRRHLREAFEQKNSKALAALATSPELLRQPPITLLFLARALRSRGNVEGEIDVLRRAQRQYPGDFWTNFNLAQALGQTRAPSNLDDAVSFLRAAIAVRPQSSATHHNLGNALRAQGKLDAAIAAFRKAIELDPRNSRPYHGLGACHHDRKELDAAIADYRTAIELDPKFAGAYSALAGALAEQKKLPEAVAACRKAIELDPNDAMTYNNLAGALLYQKKPDEAVAALRTAVQLDPKHPLAYVNLGDTLLDQGKPDEAIATYHRAIEFNPRKAELRFELGNALRAQGKLHEAVAAYREGIELDPKQASAYCKVGTMLHDQKKFDEAAAAFRESIKLNPNDAQCYSNLGLTLHAQGKLDEAVVWSRMATEVNPKSANAHNTLGMALSGQKKLDEAIACYRTAIALDQGLAKPHYNLGNALVRKGRVGEAIDCYRKAIALNRKYAFAHYNLGLALRKQGNLDDAIASYRTAVELDPHHAVARGALGDSLTEKGWQLVKNPDPKLRDRNLAVAASKEAVELLPLSIKAWQYLGWVQYRAGSWKASIEALEKACELQKRGDSGQWTVLALAHAKLAVQAGLPDKERQHHLAEARRLFEQADKRVDSQWRVRPANPLEQAIWDFRAEARGLMVPKEIKK